jgi:hypothetical protein
LIKSKEQLEKDINESQYFIILNDSNNESVRETAKGKLVIDILDYCKYYWYQNKEKSIRTFDECDDKVIQCIFDCLKPGNFDPEKKDKNGKKYQFLNYLKVAVSHKIHKFQMNKVSKLYHEPYRIKKNSPYKESDALLFDDTEKILNVIEMQFLKKLDKVKPYWQKLLTLKFFGALVKIPNLKQNYSFIDYSMLEKYTSVEDTPKQKEIAAAFGKLEQDASNKLRFFLQEVKENSEIKKIKNSN